MATEIERTQVESGMTDSSILKWADSLGLSPWKASMDSDSRSARVEFIKKKPDTACDPYVLEVIAAIEGCGLILFHVEELAPIQAHVLNDVMPVRISRLFEATYRKL